MFNFLRVMLFFPSVNFSLIKAEIFPYAGIYYLFKRPKLYRSQLFFVFCLLLSPLYGAYLYNEFEAEVLRSLSAYLNPFLIFFVIYYSDRKESFLLVKFAKVIFLFLAVLSIMQYSGLANLLGFERIFDVLMSRGNAGVMGHGRGISLLSSEPSRAGMEFLFIYSVFRYCSLNRDSRKIVYDLFVFLVIVFIVRSATGAIYSLIFFGLIYRKSSLVLFPIVIFVIGNLYTNIGIRTLDIAFSIINNASLDYFIDLFFDASGFRAISVYASYLSGISNLFGFGVGFWEYSSIEALNSSGIPASEISFFNTWNNGQYYSVRPTSYVASVMLDMGLIGMFALLFSLRNFFWNIISDRDVLPVGVVFIFYLFCMGTIGNPIPWICVAIVYNYRRVSCV